MSDTAKSPLPFRWLLVCLLPLFTAVYFHFFPATPGSSGFLINGIILACECAFLFNVLFALITRHLKGEPTYRRQTSLLFLPLILLVVYIFYYFGAF
mgnify:CR=1 FL=1